MNIRTHRQVPLAVALGLVAAISVACSNDDDSSTVKSSTPVTAVTPTGEVLLTDDFVDDANRWGVVDDPEFGSARFVGGDYVWAPTI